jgi:hypothetical protein
MHIVEIINLDDCVGRSLIRDVHFDRPVTEAFVLYLGTVGRLSYFRDLARPFYRVDIPGHFSFKGVEGASNGRLVLTGDVELAESAFRLVVSRFAESDRDAKTSVDAEDINQPEHAR